MSDTDLPTGARQLVEADPDDFDSSETFRSWVEARLGEIEADLSDQGDRDDALARQIDTLRETAEQARDRAERAERLAQWGGVGYEDRLTRVLVTLVNRARSDGGTAHLTPDTEVRGPEGSRYERPGAYDVLDGAVSLRTCRDYLDTLAGLDGLSLRESAPGGWGGGSDQKRLRIDLPAFLDSYGGLDGLDLDAALSDDGSGGSVFRCDSCGETFDTEDGLTFHETDMHGGDD